MHYAVTVSSLGILQATTHLTVCCSTIQQLLPLQASQQQLLLQQPHWLPAEQLALQQHRWRQMLQLHPSASSHLAGSFCCWGCVCRQLQVRNTIQQVSSMTTDDGATSDQLNT
jgi:hypothetical protein